ncbi:MAG: DUF1302 domain-containing protein [Telmatospirillum sp.]|nr:DUF1302 domain-containing protein [Telmatospirillum sp.]
MLRKHLVLLAVAALSRPAWAVTFDDDGTTISFDSTISAGTGIRTRSPSCQLITAGAAGSGAPQGCLGPFSGLGDQGDLNYKAGQAFTTYLKGTHELMVATPDQWKFLGRFSWLKDFTAANNSGYVSATNPTGRPMPQSVQDDLRTQVRLLALWLSKSFQVAGEEARVRVGNQVINWGESVFLQGGINQINAIDVMRLSQPGTQLKEAILPAPIVSVASGLGHGLNAEIYYQAQWNGAYLPPTGSYWSTTNGLGTGHNDYNIANIRKPQSQQYGMALRWHPEETSLNLGAYLINYQDKIPVTGFSTSGAQEWVFVPNRRLYGLSASFPLGDWAIGSELSYRPRDTVTLNPIDCQMAGKTGGCYEDKSKYQLAISGTLAMDESDYRYVVGSLGADQASLIVEAVGVKYADLAPTFRGIPVAAAGLGWGNAQANPTGLPGPSLPTGTSTSWGYNIDFSWTYDGTVLPGWRVIPEVFFFHAVSGRTPNSMAQFMAGAKSANFSLTFAQNPQDWQVGVNYSKFWGTGSPFDQPLGDRDFVGIYASRNF